jgi:alcohol dehydrogenase class IV
MSVALTAPEAFRFTFDAAPARHLRAAALLDPAVAARLPGAAADPLPSSGAGAPAASAAWRDALPDVLVALLRELGLPNGLAEVGYGAADVADLVTGALQQQRLLATAPKPVTADDLAAIFHRSLQLW